MNLRTLYINLDSRPDRQDRMIAELQRVGLEAERFPALTFDDYKGKPEACAFLYQDATSRNMPGLLGCHLSHQSVLKREMDNPQAIPLLILEDDVQFCDDLHERLANIERYLETQNWDIFFLGGTYHWEPHWHAPGHPYMPQCSCTLGRDWEPTDHPRINRTYGCFDTYAYIVNPKSIEKIWALYQVGNPVSLAADWLQIYVQPWLNCFAYNPGCAKQLDDQSDIRPGIQNFSGFSHLGPHWFKARI
jgi:GR25 family glycosyltransferase involved in LPS biosynthesis